MKYLVMLALLLGGTLPGRGQTYEAGGMKVTVTWLADSVEMHLIAPCQGWLAVGIHHAKPLPGTDLKLCRVRAGQGECSDHFVQGM